MVKATTVRGLNEVFRDIDVGKLQKMYEEDGKKEEDFSKNLYRAVNARATKSEVKMVRFDLSTSNDNLSVSDELLDYLLCLLNTAGNDIFIPPIPSTNNHYSIELARHILDKIDQQNKNFTPKPILGYIPGAIPTKKTMELIDEYVKRGVAMFGFDFRGGSIEKYSPKVRKIVNKLREVEKDTGNQSYLHAFNVSPAKEGDVIIPATDMLSYEYGFDSYGLSHYHRQYPPELLTEMAKKGWVFDEEKAKKNLKVFATEDYGHHSVESIVKDGIEGKIKKDGSLVALSTIEVAAIRYVKLKAMSIRYTGENTGTESRSVGGRIKSKEKLSEYLKEKQYVKEHIVHLEDFSRQISEYKN